MPACALPESEKIVPLHGQKIEAVFLDEEHKRRFIENLTPEEFIQLLDFFLQLLFFRFKQFFLFCYKKD